MDINRTHWFDRFDETEDNYNPWKSQFQNGDPFGTKSAHESFLKRRNSLFNRSMSSLHSAKSRTYSNSSTSPTLRDFTHNDDYRVCVNVQQFRPGEITVQCIDHVIIVSARHEEREDEFGIVSRQFTRKYRLPNEYNPKDVESVLNADGILVVKVPMPLHKEVETVIKVQHIGNEGISGKVIP